MKRKMRNVLLSTLAAATAASAITAVAFSNVAINTAFANNTTEVTENLVGFEMVDGASIRMAAPLGLRFIAEMGKDVHDDLMKEETGISKKMGMFIVPYDYLSDPTKYANGEADAEAGNYQNFTTKINHIFYDSTADNTNDADGMIYQVAGKDVWRANGVITNLQLHNYGRDFIGIAYIEKTSGETTTYTFADFDFENNVRSAAYVAIEAYEDYQGEDQESVRDIFDEYVWGAHLQANGMELNKETGKYTYNNKEYDSISDVITDAEENISWSLGLDTYEYIKDVNKPVDLGVELKGDNIDATFDKKHIDWVSSDDSVIKVDENGELVAVAPGTATVHATFMDQTDSCEVIVEAITFETMSTAPSYMSNKTREIEDFSIVEMNSDKVLQATTKASSTNNIGVFITTEVLSAFFADSTVEYMAFDVMSGGTKTGPYVNYHGNGAASWIRYETGTYDMISTNSFKTYYFPRSEYENWVNAGKTEACFVMINGSLIGGGEKLYLDNLRGVTEAEKKAAWYSFEYGGLRTNNGNTPLFLDASNNTWSIGFSNIDSTTAGFTSEIVSDGARAFTFTKFAGATEFKFNHGADTPRETAMREAGYAALDLYVPAGSDAELVNSFYGGPLQQGWNTVYVKVDATENVWFSFTDTTASTYVVDNIRPFDASSVNAITYNANGGSVENETQTVIDGAAYTLATPTAYRDFLGWKDENGNTIPMSGVWEYGNVTLTAAYSDGISFESGAVPAYFAMEGSTESLSVVDMDTTHGNKALKIQSTAAGVNPAMNVTVEFLASFFEDENVDYIAFNAKSGSSRSSSFLRYTMNSNGSMANITYEYNVAYNGIYADAWKTFYFSREDYNSWVANSITSNRFIATSGLNAGDCIYVDNIRAATQEEYAEGEYGFEIGGVRLNGNNLLFYTSRGASTWQMGIYPGAALTSYSYTNEIVSEGIRAFQFTPAANTTTALRFNPNAVTQMQTDIVDQTGYYAFDLYVPEGSDATLTYNTTTTYPGATPIKGDWMTIYVNDSNLIFFKITDTTGSTYAVDNFRSITSEEYTAATLGFEAGAGGLSDKVAASNVFNYYGGADHTANKYSFEATGTPLESVRLDSEIVHSGEHSLAFTKVNGAIAIRMRNDSTTYALLRHGFTFWIYSTVGINGKSANNFINGNGEKFNGGEGILVSKDKWMQITVTEDDIKHATTAGGACPFLTIQGSTAGTIYLDDFVALPYEEAEIFEYKTTVETEEDSVRKGIVLGESTHTYASLTALPQSVSDTEDMSYIKFGGSYGLNDFLVFDFTGDNVPLISFFTTKVTNTVYNQEENENMKGWIVANGMTTMNGLTFGGHEGAHANRLAMIGPYKISYKYDSAGSDRPIAQQLKVEGSADSPSPIGMATLQSLGDTSFRMIVGWVENGNYMNLRMYVIDLTTGQTYLNYNLNKNIAKADWEGDIALYGHFARETFVDALYPIEEDTTIEEVVAKYMPTTIVYNGEWDGEKLILAASTHKGNQANVPLSASDKEDMSYIAFEGNYGLNDYVVFDFTGDNFPFVSFFNSHITNTIFNFANDSSVEGWIIANGIKFPNGASKGGDTGAHANRILSIGSNKISYQYDNNGTTGQWSTVIAGSASDPSPIAITPLKSVTDTYRAFIGFVDNGGNGAKARIYVVNMVTGAVVVNYTKALTHTYSEGSIMLHGQFATGTVLDRVFGVEEDTTIEELLAKYAKDVDYSDEAAVTLDRYAYSSLSNGQWTLDGKEQVTNPTDFRLDANAYTTYKDAGFNIVLAQNMIGTEGTKATWEASANKTYMDNAYNAGLKVILTDWHLQILSIPLKVSGGNVVASDSTYVPWIIGTDASATTGEAAKYLGYLSSLGIEVDSTRFKNRNALDQFVYNQLAPYKDHPAFYGIMLADEPSYHNAYCYGEIYKSIKRVMPECYVQYNLLPLEHNFSTIQYRYPGVNDIGSGISNAEIETAYKSYVTAFLDTMGTDYVQYDDYPFKAAKADGISGLFGVTDPYVDPTALRNIQIVAEIAKERNLDVKVVSQSALIKSGSSKGAVRIRQITENDARWLNNYLLGFGVKQINYFTYWTKAASSSSGEYFVDGGSFVNRDGTPTALYMFMQTIMADNDKFAPTISHFDYNVSQVFGSNNNTNLNNDHISWSSSLTAAASFRWISSVTTSLEYTLVTELYDENNYNYMYMVMNTIDPNDGGTQSITVTLDSSVTKFYVYDQSGNRMLQTGNTYTVSLTAGQAVYIMPCAW